MDAVYPVRAGRNEELRYSLRSLAAHVPHEQVWLIGEPPAWVTGVRVIAVPQRSSKWANALLNWRTALDRPDLPDEFMIWNDDFFALRPVPGPPLWHYGTLAGHIADYPRSTNYRQAMERTRALLIGEGYPEPLSYELHVPMLVDKTGFSKALDVKTGDVRLLERSVYGNRAGLASRAHDDVKAYGRADPATGWWASTTTQTFTAGAAGARIRAIFAQPCRYERDAS